MQFVQGLPAGVFVGQTRVHHDRALETTQSELQGFNLALHVQDDAARAPGERAQGSVCSPVQNAGPWPTEILPGRKPRYVVFYGQ